MTSGLYSDGRWTEGHGPRLTNKCPASGEIVWDGNAADANQVEGAVASARKAFDSWSRLPQSDRTAILERYAEEIGKRTEAIAKTISRDMGKVLWETRAEAATMKAKVAVSIAAQNERAGSKFEQSAFGSSHLTHRAHGVMAVFGPFNFPGHLPNGHIVPALLAGNTCVFKPSELAPGVAALMAEAFQAAGLPDGCLNIVHGARDTGGALLNAEINGLLFTGSANTGVFFHKHFAGRPDVILALEMGGNNPLIIWDPADVEAAADIAAQSSFLTTGQRCSCARRIILPEEGSFMGPLVSEHAAQAATDFQMMLSKAGGKSLRRLKRMDRGGGFVTAGVIDVTQAHHVPDEELFGPLMQIVRVKTFDDALDRANATRYGLSGGLVSDDDALWVKAHREMRAGILNRNRPTAGASGSMPFGGPGLSGNFRPGAYYAADYCAWPQASQVADKAERMGAQGFPK